MPADARRDRLAPAVVLGIGLGSFVDGIVLHQVLGWHHMLSSVHPPTALEALHFNVMWDGLFHVAAWIATAFGVALLWRAGQQGRLPGPRRFLGGLLAGFALFNLVEGVVDHHLLKLHNVREVADPMPWNIGFLVLSALLLVAALALLRRGARKRPSFGLE
jgi:uncharacterized membrane protein